MNNDQEKTQLLRKIAKVTNDVRDVYHDIETLVRAGKMETLYQTALTLEEDASTITTMQRWAREAIFDYTEKVLSLTPSLPAVETVFKLLQIKRELTVQRPRSNLSRSRSLAPRVACAQQLSVLLDVFERYSYEEQHREFLSCLLQEMVIGGVRGEDIPVLQHFHHILQEHRHPLACLPLILTTIETDISLPEYALAIQSYPHYALDTRPYPPTDREIVSMLPTQGVRDTAGVFVETSVDAQREHIRTAVINWEQESNGRSEAKIFMADSPRSGAISPQVLPSLQLKCLEGAPLTSIVVQEVTPAQIFSQLLGAAANGGAYNSGHQGAWGRLEAWQSLSGLVGADEQASIGQILEQALQCQWYSFEAKSAWFCNVAWDLGLISIQPDRRSLVVLASTDTD